jgi:hypothetical protein
MTLPMPGPTGKPVNVRGTGYKAVSQFTPEQTQLFRQLFGQLAPESFLSKLGGGGQEMFEQLEAPAMRQFAALQGNLASRFSGLGTGARRSSGFANSIGGYASQFAQDLQAQRLGLQRQAIRDLQELSGSLLQQRPFAYLQKQKPFWQELSTALAGGIGQGIGSLPALAM